MSKQVVGSTVGHIQLIVPADLAVGNSVHGIRKTISHACKCTLINPCDFQ